jgi:hypothetical protein
VQDALAHGHLRFYEGDQEFPKKIWYRDEADRLWFGLCVNGVLGEYKGGPLKRKNALRFSASWIDNAANLAPEERATVADFSLWLNNQNVTMHLRERASYDHLTIALYPLAEGIVHDWWSLFGARDREFSLTKYRTGYAMPDVRFRFDGQSFEASAHQRTYQNPDVRFWAGSSETMSRKDAECLLSEFVTDILVRADADNPGSTGAAQRWSRIKASLADPEEARFCECAGALDIDPYQIDDASSALIQRSASLFEDEPLIEFLAGARSYAADPVLHWIAQAEKRPESKSRVADLRTISLRAAEAAPERGEEDDWALGYRRARAVRKLINVDESRRFKSTHVLAAKFGAGDSFSFAANADGIRALRSHRNDIVHIHMRYHGASMNADTAYRFSLARAIGDVVCFPSPGRAAINELHFASRQAAGRAFAAEFLAPVNEIESMRRDGHDLLTTADEFAVSPVVIERQIENALRIELACKT